MLNSDLSAFQRMLNSLLVTLPLSGNQRASAVVFKLHAEKQPQSFGFSLSLGYYSNISVVDVFTDITLSYSVHTHSC